MVLVVLAEIRISKAADFSALIDNRTDTNRTRQEVDYLAEQVAAAHQDTVGYSARNDLQNVVCGGSFIRGIGERSSSGM